jgi:hypothetical protein
MGAEIVECIATNVYLKDASGWRIVLHHSSPAGEAAESESGAGSAVLH